MLQSFQTLADTIGIELPERLAALLEIAEKHPTALASLEDFFWIDAEQAKQEIDEWLNPNDQPERTFLPFATSGGGEHYCWVRLEDGASGVAQILHKAGPKSVEKTVKAFISQDEARDMLATLSNPRPREFSALREWMR